MKLVMEEVGNGSRTAALVHGASMRGEIWRDFGRILQDEYDLRLILVDQRGHGASERADSYRVSDFADDLAENLPKNLDFLIGQSLGGVASAWAADRVQPRRYIGLDPAFTATPGAALLLRYLGPNQMRFPDVVLRAMGAPPKGSAPDTMKRIRASWALWDRTMMKQLVPSGLEQPFEPQPTAVPSTIVLADNSFVISEKAALEFRYHGWDVRVKPGAVHDMHLQDPTGLALLLDDVLRA